MVTGQQLPTPSVTCNFGRYYGAQKQPTESHWKPLATGQVWKVSCDGLSGNQGCRGAAEASSSLASMLTGPKGPGDCEKYLCWSFLRVMGSRKLSSTGRFGDKEHEKAAAGADCDDAGHGYCRNSSQAER